MYIHKTTLDAAAWFAPFSLFYWSSTEHDFSNAWGQNFYSGNQFVSNRSNAGNSVRAVRSF
jgi:hypothetical protein